MSIFGGPGNVHSAQQKQWFYDIGVLFLLLFCVARLASVFWFSRYFSENPCRLQGKQNFCEYRKLIQNRYIKGDETVYIEREEKREDKDRSIT